MTRIDFERAVERARPRLIIRALRRLDADAAEDAVQAALIIGLQKADWQAIQNVEGWLLGVVDNVINNLRRTTRFADELDDTLTCKCPDLVDQIAENDEKAREIATITAAADRAGLTRREDFIFLARLRDKSYSEIAKQLGVETGSVRASYSRALNKIRTGLGEK